MEPTSTYRPRVSRETRLLLTAGVLAVATLWILARLRFQDLPITPNPVPAVLSQLSSGSTYDDLASAVGQVQVGLEPTLLVIDVVRATPGTELDVPVRIPRQAPALRIRADLALALLPDGWQPQTSSGTDVRVRDRASGLAVVRVSNQVAALPVVPWTPRRLRQPRYLIASALSPEGVSLRPVFVGSLAPIDSAVWSQPIWAVPSGTALEPGSIVFTNTAELVGIVIEHDTGRAIVPGGIVLAEAARLLDSPPGPPGRLDVEVQPLTASIASVTGAAAGMVVTWVDRRRTAAGELMVGDVIEAVAGAPLTTREQWDVRMARLSAGETLTLQVRRRRDVLDLTLVAAAIPPASRSLGLTLRGRPGLGTEVVRVEPTSAADRAGLAGGDVITLFGEVAAPGPGQIRRSFTALGESERALVAVTRGDAHHVMTVSR